MWSHPARRMSLAGQLLFLQLAVLACVLGVVGVISVQQSTRVFETETGSQLRSVAEYVATLPVVTDQIDHPEAPVRLAGPVSQALALSAAEKVSITEVDGRIIASSDSGANGELLPLGASRAPQGRGWSGEVAQAGGRVLAAHAPILRPDGSLAALAVAEAGYPSVSERLTLAAPDLVLFLGLGALLGGAGALLLWWLLFRRTRGLAPAEVSRLADHREALLFSIREGVIGVGTDGRVTTANHPARELLGLPPDVVGRHVDGLGLGPEVHAMLLSEKESHDAVLVVGPRVLVFNQRVAASKGRGIGTVTTMRDRTELVSLQSQLSSNLSLTDTLRAQTHEFANTLHTISGLVQLEEYDEVVAMIGSMTRRRAELAAAVADRVADLPVAALVIAKTSLADEAGVRLVLDPDSALAAQPTDVSADLVTVVGNLVDNAVDACRGQPAPEVRLGFHSGPVGAGETAGEVLRVEVRDNGPGVPEDLRRDIFVRGFSTKETAAGGRGIGLALVRLVCGQRGGRVDLIHTEGWTVFRIELPGTRSDVVGAR